MDGSLEWFPSLIDFISNVGFPIFVALFLLHRMETKLDDVVKALGTLTHAVQSAH